jgi:hypothetical protein
VWPLSCVRSCALSSPGRLPDPAEGGRMVRLATIEDPFVVRRILNHLGKSTEIPHPAPCRAPPGADDLLAELPASRRPARVPPLTYMPRPLPARNDHLWLST